MDFGDNVWDVGWPEPGGPRAPYHFHRTETAAGGPLYTVNRLADAVDYFDGEHRP